MQKQPEPISSAATAKPPVTKTKTTKIGKTDPAAQNVGKGEWTEKPAPTPVQPMQSVDNQAPAVPPKAPVRTAP